MTQARLGEKEREGSAGMSTMERILSGGVLYIVAGEEQAGSDEEADVATVMLEVEGGGGTGGRREESEGRRPGWGRGGERERGGERGREGDSESDWWCRIYLRGS